MPEITLTQFASVKATFRPKPIVLAAGELKTRLCTHTRAEKKDGVPLFAPAKFEPTAEGLCKHTLDAPQGAHRCDASVSEITLLVFDADQQDEAAVQRCHRLLVEADVDHCFYSTFSYSPDKPQAAYRLAVVPSRGVAPAEFKNLRLNLIREFEIPADPGSSAGVSHSYYWPCAKPEAPVSVLKHEGKPLEVEKYLGELVEPVRAMVIVPREDVHQPPLEVLREACEEYANTPPLNNHRLYTKAMLIGAPLARPSERHKSVMSLRAALCGLFTDVDTALLGELAAPSLEAMNEGDRNFVDEFMKDIDEYQARLFRFDEATVESLRPSGYNPPSLHPAELPDLLKRARVIMLGRVALYEQRGEVGKAALARTFATGAPVKAKNMNTLVWMLTACVPGLPVEAYVAALRPCLAESTIGPNRTRQLVLNALYCQETARRAEDEFVRQAERKAVR